MMQAIFGYGGSEQMGIEMYDVVRKRLPLAGSFMFSTYLFVVVIILVNLLIGNFSCASRASVILYFEACFKFIAFGFQHICFVQTPSSSM